MNTVTRTLRTLARGAVRYRSYYDQYGHNTLYRYYDLCGHINGHNAPGIRVGMRRLFRNNFENNRGNGESRIIRE